MSPCGGVVYTGIGLDLDVCTELSNLLQVPGSTASIDSSMDSSPTGAAGKLAGSPCTFSSKIFIQ